jgi:hypothetical protein
MRIPAILALLVGTAVPLAAQEKQSDSFTIRIVASSPAEDAAFQLKGSGKDVVITSSSILANTVTKEAQFRAPATMRVTGTSALDFVVNAMNPEETVQLTMTREGREVTAKGPTLRIRRVEGEKEVVIEATEIKVRQTGA